MDLYYTSTRGAGVKMTASEAILAGLAPDGGLFVPDRIPSLRASMDELKGMSYKETAYTVMREFLTDFTEDRKSVV